MTSQFLIRILSSEVPLEGSLLGVASLLPSIDLVVQRWPAGDPSIQTLAAEDADLDLCHVEPTRVLGRVGV